MQFSTIVSMATIAILSITMATVSSAPVEAINNKTPVCDGTCTKEYVPWCAKLTSGEYKTFGNKCTLDFYKCKHPKDVVKATKGACTKPPTPVCGTACADIYDAVCATFQNGETKTFPNECELKNLMCRSPKKTYTFVKGECPKSVP
ncbi:hypothetical protein BGZ95_002865 [Linnemannia exigua]|uniref:Kazal-like domain-containing protein n=1 Tax=Linnemannia exigua TaxID=604196 RepID=A0AAD4D6P5_9FUNG|nr:hypothetical protein BGZ95_002865 [Linnemannia exigua]